jgi:hypothetical protein
MVKPFEPMRRGSLIWRFMRLPFYIWYLIFAGYRRRTDPWHRSTTQVIDEEQISLGWEIDWPEIESRMYEIGIMAYSLSMVPGILSLLILLPYGLIYEEVIGQRAPAGFVMGFFLVVGPYPLGLGAQFTCRSFAANADIKRWRKAGCPDQFTPSSASQPKNRDFLYAIIFAIPIAAILITIAVTHTQ